MRDACKTPCGIVNVRRIDEIATEPQAELGVPQALLDDAVLQRLGIARDLFLEPPDHAFRIVQRNAARCLAEINDTAESERRLLVVVVTPDSLAAFRDDRFHL